jgi:hypothetical protein
MMVVDYSDLDPAVLNDAQRTLLASAAREIAALEGV